METYAEQGNAIGIVTIWERATCDKLHPLLPSMILELLKTAKERNPLVDINRSVYIQIKEIRTRISRSQKIDSQTGHFRQNRINERHKNTRNLRKYLELLQEMSLDGMESLESIYVTLLSTSCHNGEVDMIGDTLHSMREAGFCPEDWGYGFAMKAYSEAITVDTADKILAKCDRLASAMKVDGLEPGVHFYTSWIKAYGRGGRIMDAGSVLEDVRRSGVRLSLSTFAVLMRGYEQVATAQNFWKIEKHCTEILEWIDTEGLCPDIRIYNAFINACCKGGGLKRCISLLEEIRRREIPADRHTYTTIIKAHTMSVTPHTTKLNYNRCLELVAEAKEIGLKPDCVMYNAFLNVCHKGKLLKEAMALFKEMEETWVTPDANTYTTLISVHAQCVTQDTAQESFDACQGLLSKIRETGVKSTNRIYNALLNVCSKGGLVREAGTVYENMRIERVSPDIITFNTLIDGQAQFTTPENVHETWMRSQAIVDEMKRMGFKPQTLTCNALLNICRNGRMPKRSLEILEEMHRKKIPRKVSTYATIFDAQARSVSPETGPEVWKLCQELMAMLRADGIKPNAILYNVLLNICRKGGLVHEIDTVVGHLRRDGYRPGLFGYNVVIATYAQSITPETVAEVLRKCRSLVHTMKHEAVTPDEDTYNTLLEMCRVGGRVVEMMDTFEEMIGSGVIPNGRTYATLIDGESQIVTPDTGEAHLERCREWVLNLERWGATSDIRIYNSLLSVCSKGEMLEAAIDVFEEMRRKRLDPNIGSYNTLMRAYAQSATPDTAKKVYQKCRALKETMVSEEIRPDLRTYSALLTICAKGRLSEKLPSVFEEINQSAPRSDASSYHAAVDAFEESITETCPEIDGVEEFLRRAFAEKKNDEAGSDVETFSDSQKLDGVKVGTCKI